MREKVLLIIMDGIGVAPKGPGNAVALAQPQNLIRLWETNPHTYIEASGRHVGLAEATNGNSEVGHLTIGSGKINYQNLLKINNAIKKGTFFENRTLKTLLYHVEKYHSKIHLIGCLSDGSVHSHIEHFIATLEFLHKNNFKGEAILHIFTDGRDVPPKSASKYLERIEQKIQSTKIGRIGTICGRAYAMDRNNMLSRTRKAYDLLVFNKGRKANTWQEAIQQAYVNGETDEYIDPTFLDKNIAIENNDAVFFLNFRPDRALQLTKMIKGLIPDNLPIKNIDNMFFMGMVEYDKNFPEKIAFPKEYLSLPIGRIISDTGLRQIRITESEKYAHVTYFMNGGLPIQYAGEDRIKIPSPSVKTYNLKPEMSAIDIMNATIQKLHRKQNYRFMVINLANGDLVGHTGDIQAAVKAIHTIDYVTNNIIKNAKAHGWTIILTADHGNAERMIDTETNEKLTEHTQNPVPMVIVGSKEVIKNRRLTKGGLADIAPTILKIMNIKKPTTMMGKSLLT